MKTPACGCRDTDFGLQFYCHVQPLKVAELSDFYPPTYVSTLPAL